MLILAILTAHASETDLSSYVSLAMTALVFGDNRPSPDVESLLLAHLHAVLPQSAFGRALHYLYGQWPKLIRYVENGAWPISTNSCENAIRPFVVGRKAWLFCYTVGGATAARICTR